MHSIKTLNDVRAISQRYVIFCSWCGTQTESTLSSMDSAGVRVRNGTKLLQAIDNGLNISKSCSYDQLCIVSIYRVAQKSKLLILAVNEINASQTRVSFAKFIPTLLEKMFDMCSIVPNYSLKSLRHSFILLLMNVCDSRFHSVTSACFNWSTDSNCRRRYTCCWRAPHIA